jgi:hypothetical protein
MESPKAGELHDVPDVLRRVDLARAVGTVQRQLRHAAGVEGEAGEGADARAGGLLPTCGCR